MDIKDLNKNQLLLLAVLLSFVTSIVTGITTVTLMDQAPSSMTVPINRVVRQTVEKIVPTDKEVQTVVIKEEDLIVDAIAKNKTTVFAITKEMYDPTVGTTVEVSAGRAVAVSDKGILVADALQVPGGEIYYVKNDSGKYKASFVSSDKNGFSFLKIGNPLDEKNKLAFTLPTYADLSKMKVGQKILILGNGISSFIYDGAEKINLNVSPNNSGSLVLNLDGEALGIALSVENSSFIPFSLMTEALKGLKTE